MIYLFNYFIMTVFSFQEVIKQNKNIKIIFTLFLIYLIIFTGFSDTSVGRDKLNFYNIFCKIFETGKATNIEVGWEYIVKISKYFFNDMYIVFLLISICSLGIKICMFRYLTPYYIIATTIYFSTIYYYYEFEAIRQALALALTFYSSKYVYEKKMIKFFTLVLLASKFHSSAILFIPFFFIGNLKIKKKLIFLSLIVAFVLGQNIEVIQNVGVELGKIIPRIAIRIKDYSSTSYFREFKLTFIDYIKFLFLVIFILNYEKTMLKSKYERKYRLALNGYFIYCLLTLLFYRVEVFMTRGSVYYRIFESVLISFLFLRMKLKKRKILFILIIIYFSIFNIKFLSSKSNKLLPYKNYLLE